MALHHSLYAGHWPSGEAHGSRSKPCTMQNDGFVLMWVFLGAHCMSCCAELTSNTVQTGSGTCLRHARATLVSHYPQLVFQGVPEGHCSFMEATSMFQGTRGCPTDTWNQARAATSGTPPAHASG